MYYKKQQTVGRIFTKSIRHLLSKMFMAAFLITAIGCTETTTTNQPDKAQVKSAFGESGKKGLFRAFLTDFPIGGNEVSRVLVTIERLEVHSAELGWLTVVEYPEGRVYNLLDLQDGKTEDLGELSLEPGKYNQIRIILSSENQIEVDEGNGTELKPLTIPSGEQTGIKLIHPFDVPVQGVTSLTLDFNAQESVIKAGNDYKLKPSIKVINTETVPGMSKLISADEGGEMIILGKVDVQVPPGALSEDTRIEIVPKKAANLPQLFGSHRLLNEVYDLQPDGLQFNKDINISIHYDESEIVSMGLNENNAHPFYYNEDIERWQIMEGSTLMNQDTVQFPTNHFTNFGISISPEAGQPIISYAYLTEINDGEAPWKVKAKVYMPDASGTNQYVYKVVAYYRAPTDSKWWSVQLEPTETPDVFAARLRFPEKLVNSQLEYSDLLYQVSGPGAMQVYIKAQAFNMPGINQPVSPIEPLLAGTTCAPMIDCQLAKNLPYIKKYNPDVNGNSVNDLWQKYYEITNLTKDNDLDGTDNLTEFLNRSNPRMDKMPQTYWAQRLQMLNKLIEVGPDAGQSLISSGTVKGHFGEKNGNGTYVKTDFLGWGDTVVKSGWYIGILATEYKRLKMAGNDTDARLTLNELYYALKAIERLDVHAERFHYQINNKDFSFFPPQWKRPNGFFSRDDISHAAYEHYKAKKPLWVELPERGSSTAIVSEGTGGGGSIKNGQFVIDQPKRDAYEMSQDQFIHLQMGLSLVRKYIRADASIKGENIRQLAINISTRTIDMIQSSPIDEIINPATLEGVHIGSNVIWVSGELCVTRLFMLNGWYSHADRDLCELINPVSGHFVSKHSYKGFERTMGSLAIAYSNYEDRSSYPMIQEDRTFEHLEEYDLGEYRYMSKEEIINKYGSDVFDDSGYVYLGDVPLEKATSPDHKRLEIWFDGEEVFGMVNVALFNKNNYYSASDVKEAIRRLDAKTMNYGTLALYINQTDISNTLNEVGGNNPDDYYLSIFGPHGLMSKYRYVKSKPLEARLEAMLMKNLYHILYTNQGLGPNPMVQDEVKRQVERNTGRKI